MRIFDGNIFEAMRLMLPEHKEAIRRADRDRRKRKPPEVDESRLAEMEYVIAEALEYGQRVRLTLFAPVEDAAIEGNPVIQGGLLYIQTTAGKQRVPVGRLMRVEVLDS